jgi:hypothetical protein
VRYVLVPDMLPRDRPDVMRIMQGSTEVYRGEGVTIYERQPVPPHVWIVHEVTTVTPGEALSLLADGSIDPYQTALVEGSSPRVAPAANIDADQAIVTRYAPERIDIETHTAAPAFLVLSEIYAEGWTATVNGHEVPILPTQHALRGVAIPAGSTTVEFRYAPRPLRVGMAISGIAMLAFGLIVLDAASSAWNRGKRAAF